MYLVLGDGQLPVSLVDQRVEVSPFTGRDLRVLDLEAEARNEQVHRELLDAIGSEYGVELRKANGEEGGRWSARLPYWSSSDASGASVYSYKLEVKEMEDYEVETLRVGEIDLEPRRYNERADADGTLSISLVAELDQTGMGKFRSLWLENGSFPALRVGVDESPRRMRLGQTFWSEHEGGFKIHTTLVDVDEEDAASGMSMWSLTLPTDLLRGNLAVYAELVDRLFGVLKDKGVLSEEEAEAIASAAAGAARERQFEFFEVDDAELLP